MLEQKVAFRAFAAVYTLVVLQDVLHIVHSHWVVALDLAAVTANDLHAQTSCNHLPLVPIFVVLVFRVPAGVVI